MPRFTRRAVLARSSTAPLASGPGARPAPPAPHVPAGVDDGALVAAELEALWGAPARRDATA